MTFPPQALGHHPFRLARIKIHLEPPARRQLLQCQAAADEVERTRGAAQVDPGLGLLHFPRIICTGILFAGISVG